MSVTRPWGDIAQAHKPTARVADAALFELIPEDECPIDCSPAQAERCAAVAVVRATTSSGYERRPLCGAHAHVVFADWMVGI
jgi:hypothetical protein